MRIYNYRAETCQVYSHDVKENVLNFRQFLEYFGFFFGGLKLQGMTKKNSTSISQEKCTGYCREFKGK